MSPFKQIAQIEKFIHPSASVRASISLLSIRPSVRPSVVCPSVGPYHVIDDSESTTRRRDDRQTSGGHKSADVVARRITVSIGSLLALLGGRLLHLLRVLFGVLTVGGSRRRVVAAVVGDERVVRILAGTHDGMVAGSDRRRWLVHRIFGEGCRRAVLVDRR